MFTPLPTRVLLAIQDAAVRDRVRAQLPALCDHPRIAPYCRLWPKDLPDLQLWPGEFQAWYAEEPDQPRAVILVSDQFPEPDADAAAAAEPLHDFSTKLYARIALREEAGRLRDIDRVLARNYTAAQLERAFALCALRLHYLRPLTAAEKAAQKRRLAAAPEVRPLAGPTELKEYFELRHKVYTPMGYLEEWIEEHPRRWDVDWCDTRAVHFAAFLDTRAGPKIIGTARLIATEPWNDGHGRMVQALVAPDARLRKYVREGALLSRLTVFQSDNHLDTRLHRRSRGGWRFAEVSRVIVDPEYRGAGVSQRLVDAAVKEADAVGAVDELFLECLEVHAGLYEKQQFRRVPGAVGNVYGVNRTMIVMHRPLRRSIVTPAVANP